MWQIWRMETSIVRYDLQNGIVRHAPVGLSVFILACTLSAIQLNREDETSLSLDISWTKLWKWRTASHSCCLVICLFFWFVLYLYFLSKFHRWDLASKSHTKSFTEEVLRWEIDLEGSKKPLQILKTSKQVIFLGRGDVPVRGAVAGKENHDEHFQLRLEVSD